MIENLEEKAQAVKEEATLGGAEVEALLMKLLDKSDAKKETESIEYKYVYSKLSNGNYFYWDYRKEGQVLFKWNGEFWKEQTENVLKGHIADWLKKNHPTKFSSKSLGSIYTMFMATVKPFNERKLGNTIIPTKIHWLKVNDETGEITAIQPNKDLDIRYQIDIEVKKAGQFLLPVVKEQPAVAPPAQRAVKPSPRLGTPTKATNKATLQHFLESSLPNLDKRNLVQEYAGYSLTNSVKKQVFQIWVGKGANGKSVLIELLAKIHGQAVSVNISKVHEYNNHLIGASLIYCTEASKQASFDQEFLKQAVSGDKIELRGIYSKKQNAYLTAKWVMLMNAMPHIDDFSDGLFRRTQIIDWDVQFDGKGNNPQPIDDLAIKILENEKEEFLIWCLQGLQRLIKAKWKFTVSKEVDKNLEDWKNSADKIRLFVSEFNYLYTKADNLSTPKVKMFEAFNNWAIENNFAQVNSTTFWMRMANIFPQIKTDPEKKVDGQRVVFIKAMPT